MDLAESIIFIANNKRTQRAKLRIAIKEQLQLMTKNEKSSAKMA